MCVLFVLKLDYEAPLVFNIQAADWSAAVFAASASACRAAGGGLNDVDSSYKGGFLLSISNYCDLTAAGVIMF